MLRSVTVLCSQSGALMSVKHWAMISAISFQMGALPHSRFLNHCAPSPLLKNSTHSYHQKSSVTISRSSTRNDQQITTTWGLCSSTRLLFKQNLLKCSRKVGQLDQGATALPVLGSEKRWWFLKRTKRMWFLVANHFWNHWTYPYLEHTSILMDHFAQQNLSHLFVLLNMVVVTTTIQTKFHQTRQLQLRPGAWFILLEASSLASLSRQGLSFNGCFSQKKTMFFLMFVSTNTCLCHCL